MASGAGQPGTSGSTYAPGRPRARRDRRNRDTTRRTGNHAIPATLLLPALGHEPVTDANRGELPDKIDADNAQHAAPLSKHGIVPGSLSGHLGGLGKSL